MPLTTLAEHIVRNISKYDIRGPRNKPTVRVLYQRLVEHGAIRSDTPLETVSDAYHEACCHLDEMMR